MEYTSNCASYFAEHLRKQSRGNVIVAGDFSIIETFESKDANFVYLWTYQEGTGWQYTHILDVRAMLEALRSL